MSAETNFSVDALPLDISPLERRGESGVPVVSSDWNPRDRWGESQVVSVQVVQMGSRWTDLDSPRLVRDDMTRIVRS